MEQALEIIDDRARSIPPGVQAEMFAELQKNLDEHRVSGRATTTGRRTKAGVTATLVAEESTTASWFLMDHDYDDDFREYNVWINRRRVGPEAMVEPGDSVTIGPRTIRKVFPLSATRARVVRPGPDQSIGALLRQWVEEGDPEEDRMAFEEFKKAINETRAREGRPPVYP